MPTLAATMTGLKCGKSFKSVLIVNHGNGVTYTLVNVLVSMTLEPKISIVELI